ICKVVSMTEPFNTFILAYLQHNRNQLKASVCWATEGEWLHTHICSHTHTHTHTTPHTHPHPTHTHTHTNPHTHIKQIKKYRQDLSPTVHTHTHSRTHSHTHTHTLTHTLSHTHSHTHTL